MNRLDSVPHRPTDQRNYLLTIVNGISIRLGMQLSDPSLVLSVFVRLLGGSNTLVGLLPTIRFGGWFLPQFLAASWIQPRPRKVPISVVLETNRIVIYGSLAILTCTLGPSRPQLLLWIFFALFTVSRLITGTSALARLDAVGKVISSSRRASFFATRNFWSGVLVFGAGFLVRYMLDPVSGQPFPLGFTLLFFFSCCSFAAATLVLAQVKEEPGPTNQTQHSLKAQLVRTPTLLKQNPSFQRYLLVQVLLNMALLAAPFYSIFALDILGAPPSMVGVYLSATTFAGVLSNLLWQKVERAHGTYSLLRAASLLTALTPLLATTLPWLMRLAGLTVEQYGLLPAYLFAGVFLLAGSSESGRTIGMMALLLDIAPDEERASYIGLANTILGIVSFLPILAGAVIDQVGFGPVFFVATSLLSLGYLVTLGWNPAD